MRFVRPVATLRGQGGEPRLITRWASDGADRHTPGWSSAGLPQEPNARQLRPHAWAASLHHAHQILAMRSTMGVLTCRSPW